MAMKLRIAGLVVMTLSGVTCVASLFIDNAANAFLSEQEKTSVLIRLGIWLAIFAVGAVLFVVGSHLRGKQEEEHPTKKRRKK